MFPASFEKLYRYPIDETARREQLITSDSSRRQEILERPVLLYNGIS